jgi:hypothetical protein
MNAPDGRATRGEILDLLWVDWPERRDAAGDDTMKKRLWQGALKRQSMEIRSGDIVLLHTGWGALWMKDNTRFAANAPVTNSF